jgi:hypothetical protein
MALDVNRRRLIEAMIWTLRVTCVTGRCLEDE